MEGVVLRSPNPAGQDRMERNGKIGRRDLEGSFDIDQGHISPSAQF
jgi:hypothetical protein